MAEQSHKKPEGIERMEKGVYRSFDSAIEIRQQDDGRWTATVVAEVEGRELKVGQVLTEKPLRTRGDVVKLLDEQKLLPPAPAKPKPAEAEKAEVEQAARPMGRKPRKPAKAAATV
jgi:hypothetical protein